MSTSATLPRLLAVTRRRPCRPLLKNTSYTHKCNALADNTRKPGCSASCGVREYQYATGMRFRSRRFNVDVFHTQTFILCRFKKKIKFVKHESDGA